MMNLSQFLQTSNQKKKSHWWIIGVALLGIMVILGQVLYAPENTSSPAAAESGASVSTAPTDTESPGFLPEYNPDNPELASMQTDNRPFWQVALDMSVKLLLVIALIYGMLIGMKWLQKVKNPAASGTATIQVLETVGLSPGRSLHLVVVGEKTLLLGSTEQNINALTELATNDAPLDEALIDDTPDVDTAYLSAFEAKLKTVDENQVSRFAKAEAETMEWSDTLSKMRNGVQNFRHAVGGNQE